MSLNVFEYNPLSWKYPSNWLKNIHYFFRRYKWAWQRAKRGFADCDIWDLDSSILDYLYGTLNFLADNHYGYPGDDIFPTDESWTEFLKAVAQKFYQANRANEYYATPEAEKWWEWFKEHSNTVREDNPYFDAMNREENENELKRENDFSEAWSLIGKVFWLLCD